MIFLLFRRRSAAGGWRRRRLATSSSLSCYPLKIEVIIQIVCSFTVGVLFSILAQRTRKSP